MNRDDELDAAYLKRILDSMIFNLRGHADYLGEMHEYARMTDLSLTADWLIALKPLVIDMIDAKRKGRFSPVTLNAAAVDRFLDTIKGEIRL